LVAASIVGRERELELLTVALDQGRDVLLEGPPGTSKTTLLRAVAASWDVPLVFVEGNAELTPARLLGTHDPSALLERGYVREAFEPGPLVRAMEAGGLLYIEEFNRAPEETLNVLLTAIADREVAVPRLGTVTAAPGFRLIGAMNPYDNVGTTRLSVSVRDRFCRLPIGYQSAAEEVEIVRRRCVGEGEAFDETVATAAVALARMTRIHPDILHGGSVRGAIDLYLVATGLLKAREVAPGPGEVTDAALVEALSLALSGRVVLDPAAEVGVDELLQALWDEYRFGGAGENLLESVARVPRRDRPGGTAAADAPPFRKRPKPLSEAPKLSAAAGGGGLAATGSSPRGRGESSTAARGGAEDDGAGGDDEEGGPPGPEVGAALRLAREIASRLALAPPSPRRRRPTGREAFVPADRGEGELDPDRTLERLVAWTSPRREAVVVRERQGERRAILLALDVSGSIGRDRLLTTAALAGALTAELANEDLGVIAFWTDAAMLLRPGERSTSEALVAATLALETGGLTNLAFPLETAATELAVAPRSGARVVLVSDCVHNAGPDPRRAAASLPRLDVLLETGGEQDAELARELASRGRGLVTPIAGHRDVAPALARIFAA